MDASKYVVFSPSDNKRCVKDANKRPLRVKEEGNGNRSNTLRDSHANARFSFAPRQITPSLKMLNTLIIIV